MDPNQEKHERCGYCRRKLPADRTRYCDRVCANRASKRRKEARAVRAGKMPYSRFARLVFKPLSIDELAEATSREPDTVRAWAEAKIRAGELLGYRKDGALTVVGRPLRPGEVPEWVQELRRNPQTKQQRQAQNERLKARGAEQRRRAKDRRKAEA